MPAARCALGAALACALVSLIAGGVSAPPALAFVPDVDGGFNLSVDGAVWFAGVPPSLCLAGTMSPLVFQSSAPDSGTDAFGVWRGSSLRFGAGAAPPALLVATLKSYPASPGVAVASASFPSALDVSGCGDEAALGIAFPAFDLSRGDAAGMGALTWTGTAVSSTPTGAGLAALAPGGLDSGPIVTFARALDAAASPALTWSSLDSHKIITQRVATPPSPSTPRNITALWSAERADQLVCGSDLCDADQKPTGGYLVQRIEGLALALSAADAARGKACVNGALVATAPLIFAWSESREDNWAGSVAGALQRAPPDASYADMGGNGAVVAEAGVAGTVPLVAYTKAYGNRTDWAAVASPAGVAWAAAQGYAPQYTIGYVFAEPPSMCDGGASPAPTHYQMGLVASVPAVPAGWQYSVVFTTAVGGPTAATYAHGTALRRYKNTTRLPSVTLTDVGYYTDDGAYYYVWEAFNIPARPWPAEVGLLQVKERLQAQGVPVAYM